MTAQCQVCTAPSADAFLRPSRDETNTPVVGKPVETTLPIAQRDAQAAKRGI